MKRHSASNALPKAMLATLTVALCTGTASADTLREALVSTYNANPTLAAQRQSLKGTDAGVAVAKAGARPVVSGVVGVSRDLSRSGLILRSQGSDKDVTLNGAVDLSMPLYQGGGVKNNIKAAKVRVEAGRATLRAVEGDIFTEAVAAYMDVIRDRAIVELNENQVKVLTTNLEATRDRFEIGDLTRTDVAQSEARLSGGQANLAVARGRLTASEENYRRVIGRDAGKLQPPPPLPPLPTTADEAVRIALVHNPDLIAITKQAEAAGFDVKVAGASRAPTVSGVLSGDYVNVLSNNDTTNFLGQPLSVPNSGTSTTIGVQARVPIYQGGLPAARVRQAQAVEGQALEQRIATERSVVSVARSAHATYLAATMAIQSNQVGVKANELALEGARAENSVGTRTILEVLNAEQELLNSQVALVTARRDQYVAGFQLLNVMGQAEADDLGLDGGPLYDPLGNYRLVANNYNDWAGEKQRAPVSTSTVRPEERPVDQPAQ